MVYFYVVSADIASAPNSLTDLDAIIQVSADSTIDNLFQNGTIANQTFMLNKDQVLLIRGSRGSLQTDLNRYRASYIALVQATGGGDRLAVRACLVKTRFGANDRIYIAISSSNWKGYKFCPELYIDRSQGTPQPNPNRSVQLGDIADELTPPRKVAEIKDSEVGRSPPGI